MIRPALTERILRHNEVHNQLRIVYTDTRVYGETTRKEFMRTATERLGKSYGVNYIHTKARKHWATKHPSLFRRIAKNRYKSYLQKL